MCNRHPTLTLAAGLTILLAAVAAPRAQAECEPRWLLVGSGMNSSVLALTACDGELIAGGEFTRAGGTAANYIACWDGSTWSPLGSGTNEHVYALTVYNGELIAGGWFSTAGGTEANYVARWDGASWAPLGSGMSGHHSRVEALAVYNGELIAGGHFDTAGGTEANNIARWDGTTWWPLGSGIRVGVGSAPAVFALTVYDSELIAGGWFWEAGGTPVNHIARWDGATWAPLGSGLKGGIGVRALTVYNGELIAGGNFDTAGGTPANFIARWGGSTWSPLGSGMAGGHANWPGLYALAVYNGELIAGGDFSTAGDYVSAFWARWGQCSGDIDCDGDTDHADLGALLGAWDSQPGDPHWNENADLDGNGHIGHGDLGVLLGDWGCGT